MSGSRTHFIDQLMHELKSSLALLSKNAKQHSVDFDIAPDFTIYTTNIQCHWQAVELSVTPPTTQTVGNTIIDIPIQLLDLLSETPTLHAEACHFQATVIDEPVFDQTACALHEITFDGIHSINRTPAKTLPCETIALPKNTASWPVEENKPYVFNADLPRFKLSFKPKQWPIPTLKSNWLTIPSKFWTLPFRRTAIPPHRFTPEQKAVFRKALAEKANVPQANIQLQVIFDRINMGLFATIEQDEKGNLVCYPKPDYVGKNLSRAAANTATLNTSAYLVLGTRMDTKEALRTLVYAEDLMSPTDTGGTTPP